VARKYSEQFLGLKKNLKAIGDNSCVCSGHFRESDYILSFTGIKCLILKLPFHSPQLPIAR
jgi:hypothetical protein